MTSVSNISDSKGKGDDQATHPNCPKIMTDPMSNRNAIENSTSLMNNSPVIGNNKDGGKLVEEQAGTAVDSSAISFTIPKIQRKKLELLSEVALSSYEYQQDILSNLVKNFFHEASTKDFVINKCFIVHNKDLMTKFVSRRRMMKSCGYLDKELAESFGFLVVHPSQLHDICKNGLKIGNQTTSVLGHPEMGVQINRYADILQPSPSSYWKGILIMFRFIKGKVKSVSENLSGVHCDPTPNFDCHLNKLSLPVLPTCTPQQIYHLSQIYLYEYQDCCLIDYPTQIIPYAVLEAELQDKHISVVPSGKNRLNSSSHFPLPCSSPVSSSKLDRPAEEYITWNGKLSVKDSYHCDVTMVSTAGYFKPVRIGTTINICNRTDISKAEVKYFGQINSLNRNEEIYWRGRYINIAELTSKPHSKVHFQRILSYLSGKKSMAVIKPDINTDLFLLPECPLATKLGLTRSRQPRRDVLYCLFLSKQSARYKSPQYTYNMYHTEGVVLGIQDYDIRSRPVVDHKASHMMLTPLPVSNPSLVNSTASPNKSSIPNISTADKVDSQQFSCLSKHSSNIVRMLPEKTFILETPSQTLPNMATRVPESPHASPGFDINCYNPRKNNYCSRHSTPNTVTSLPILNRVGSFPPFLPVVSGNVNCPPFYDSPPRGSPSRKLVNYDDGFSVSACQTSTLRSSIVMHTFDCQFSLEQFRLLQKQQKNNIAQMNIDDKISSVQCNFNGSSILLGKDNSQDLNGGEYSNYLKSVNTSSAKFLYSINSNSVSNNSGQPRKRTNQSCDKQTADRMSYLCENLVSRDINVNCDNCGAEMSAVCNSGQEASQVCQSCPQNNTESLKSRKMSDNVLPEELTNSSVLQEMPQDHNMDVNNGCSLVEEHVRPGSWTASRIGTVDDMKEFLNAAIAREENKYNDTK